MSLHLQSCYVLILLLVVNRSVQYYCPATTPTPKACSATLKCDNSTECCLGQIEDDPAPVCAPLGQKGDQCTTGVQVRKMGALITETTVFTGYCPCFGYLACTGDSTKKYCV